MSKKYYHIIIGLLIVLNIFSWRFWWEKPPVSPVIEQIKHRREGRHDGKNIFFEKLNLTEEQKVEFEKLKKDYFKKVEILNKEIEGNRRLLIESYENNITANDSLFEVMGKNKMLLEKATFNHFKSLREVCVGEQRESFDSIASMMVKRFNRWPQKRKDGKGFQRNK